MRRRLTGWGAREKGAPPERKARGADVWQNWSGFRFWHLGLLVALVAAVGSAVADPEMSGGRRIGFASLAVILGGWYWWGIVREHAWSGSRSRTLTYYLGFVLGFSGLVLLHPAAFFLTFAVYWQLYALLPLRPAIAGSLVVSVLLWLLGAAEDGRLPRPTPVAIAILLVSVAVGGLLAGYIDAIIRQSADRRRLIEELEAARLELAAAERRAGVLSERQRLAGEIHDTLAQGFASIVMNLEAAEGAIGRDSGTTNRHLDRARRTARESLSEARRLVWALAPQPLARSTLPEALARLTERWGDESGAAACLTVTGEIRPLRPEVEVTLLRVAQEAATNARKHAEARRLVVTLSYLDDAVTLDVQDDGRGFGPELAGPAEAADGRTSRPAGEGFGLTAMRARVEAAGGSIAVESEPGAGATIAVALPAPPDEGADGALTGRAAGGLETDGVDDERGDRGRPG